MQYVLKIYTKQTDATPIAQITDIQDITLSEDINGISTATITIKPDVPNISQYRKIEVYEVSNNTDVRVFLGYVDSFTPQLDKIVLNCKNEKWLLARKLVTIDRTFTTQTVTQILTQLFADWNGTFSEDWSVLTSIATTTTKTVKIGDNLYDIIEELATTNGAVWSCTDRVIKIETLLGTDYTGASNFKELVYNGGNPRENNIDSVAYDSFGTLSNIIIGDDGTTKSTNTDATSIASYWPLAEYISFRPGDVANNSQNYLNTKKGGQFVYKVVVSPFNFEANIGDKVQLRIENVSSYFNFTGSVIINTKKNKIVNGTKVTQYEISDKYVYFDDFASRFLGVESDLSLKLVR